MKKLIAPKLACIEVTKRWGGWPAGTACLHPNLTFPSPTGWSIRFRETELSSYQEDGGSSKCPGMVRVPGADAQTVLDAEEKAAPLLWAVLHHPISPGAALPAHTRKLSFQG